MKAPLTSALRDYSMLIALGAIWAFFGLEHPVFLSSRNLSLLLIELSITASLALGMLLVLLPGQIDLSAGSGVGLSGALAAVLVFSHGTPAPLALLLVIVTNQYRGVPLPALILGALALSVYVLTAHTPFGRYLYAIGSNEEAALISGVPIQRTVITAFALMGGVVALTGFMQ